MYRLTTQGIEILVEPFYLEERSDPAESHYVWAYRITIANHSSVAARLVSRYWRITDANGKVEEVEGYGVVGEQPEIGPGDSYQYTSGCPLATPSGIMVGHYTMIDANGRRFDVAIPAFSLDVPDTLRTIN
jgi:ApaG protein